MLSRYLCRRSPCAVTVDRHLRFRIPATATIRSWTEIVHPSSALSSRFFSESSSDLKEELPTHLTPQGILKAYYISKHSGHPSVLDLLNDLAFEFEEQKWGQRTWHTARFVCPLTKQVYEAGKLSSRDIYEQWNWSKGDRKNPIRINDKLYYARKQTAAHAAAARWLDSINSLQSGQLSPEESYCVDDLALLSTIHDVDNMSDDDRIGVGAQVGGLSVDHPDPMERRKRNEANQNLLKLMASSCSPTTVLLEYYQMMNVEFDLGLMNLTTPLALATVATVRLSCLVRCCTWAT